MEALPPIVAEAILLFTMLSIVAFSPTVAFSLTMLESVIVAFLPIWTVKSLLLMSFNRPSPPASIIELLLSRLLTVKSPPILAFILPITESVIFVLLAITAVKSLPVKLVIVAPPPTTVFNLSILESVIVTSLPTWVLMSLLVTLAKSALPPALIEELMFSR